jgi:hypothetical protein
MTRSMLFNANNANVFQWSNYDSLACVHTEHNDAIVIG